MENFFLTMPPQVGVHLACDLIGCLFEPRWQIVSNLVTHIFQVSPRDALITLWWGTFKVLQTACFIPPSSDLMKFKTVPEVLRISLPFLPSTSHTSAHIYAHSDTIFELYPLNSLRTKLCKFYLTLSVDVGKREVPWSSYNTTEIARDNKSLIADLPKI